MLSPESPDGPVVLIVPGSGHTDRDGNSPQGLKASTYRLLAEGLAARGIASVRIDKRGMFGSRAAVADANAVTIGAYAEDVGAWIAAIRRWTGVGCVWLLGHSEGGLVAMVAAAKPADTCGLLLAAAPGRPLGDILRAQFRSNPANAPLLDQAWRAIAALEAGERVPTGDMHPALLPLFRPEVQDFMIDLLKWDPAALLAEASVPVLVLQGARDLQIDVQDARRLKAANPAAELVLIPDANHVLKTVPPDDRAANLATYANPNLPLAEGVTEALAQFIRSGTGRGR